MRFFNKNIAASGAFLMVLAVVLGAFGAHGLQQIVSPAAVQSFEVGVRYHTYHALAILILSVLPLQSEKLRKTTFILLLTGIILFSGSIYLLTFKENLSFDPGMFGLVTPLGGVFFIIGWLWLGVGILKLKKQYLSD